MFAPPLVDATGAPAEPAHAYVELLTAVPPRLLTYAALLLTVGVAVWRLWIYPRVGVAVASDAAAFGRARRRVAFMGVLGAIGGLVAAGWLLAVQLGALDGAGDSMLGALVAHTRWGRFWSVQAAAFAVAGLAFWAAHRADAGTDVGEVATRAYVVAGAAAGVAAAAQAGLGHAAADEAFPRLALVAAGAHVLGAATWLGTLAVLAIAWLALAPPEPDPVDVLIAPAVARTPAATARLAPTPLPTPRTLADVAYGHVAEVYAAEVHTSAVVTTTLSGRAGRSAASEFGQSDLPRRLPPAALVAPQVAVFSRVALVAAAITVAAGTSNAWMRLAGASPDAGAADRLAALTTSPYGWLLVAKLALVVVVAAVGAVNWRRHTPRLAEPDGRGGMATLDGATRVELGVAAAVLVLSAALALTSPPGTE